MNLLIPELARIVVGILYKINKEGGAFLSDENYVESVKYELELRNLKYHQNAIINLEYLGKLIDQHIVEFIIEG